MWKKEEVNSTLFIESTLTNIFMFLENRYRKYFYRIREQNLPLMEDTVMSDGAVSIKYDEGFTDDMNTCFINMNKETDYALGQVDTNTNQIRDEIRDRIKDQIDTRTIRRTASYWFRVFIMWVVFTDSLIYLLKAGL